jgi:hypothetical protein
MKQIDRNFENLMKRVKPDSPSDRFTLSVMQRIQTEAALTPKPLLHDYKPVISRPMWIALAAIFVGFIVFLSMGQAGETDSGQSLLSFLNNPQAAEGAEKVSQVGRSLLGYFTAIPKEVFIIFLAAFALWTLDQLLGRSRKVQEG